MKNIISVKFSEPDTYGEIHSSLEANLSINDKVAYFELSINDNAPAKYRLDYHDAGTTGYAAMNGQYAINGRLTNVSMDWSKAKPSDFGIINVVGSIDNGVAKLHLWRKAIS